MANQTGESVVEEKRSASPRSKWRKLGVLFGTLAIILFFCAFGYGYLQLARVNLSIAHMVSDLQKQVASQHDDVATLQKSVADLEQRSQTVQDLSAKQEQIIADWRAAQQGDLEKWYVAEAQYLVRLANDHLQFTHNTVMALTLMQRADEILHHLDSSNLLEIRKSVANDIVAIEAIPKVDITQLYLRLSALNNQIDQLPLPASPLKSDTSRALPVAPAGTPWWQVGLNRTWDALNKIVIVRYNSNSSLPLVMPEEKTFLYQNMHAQMEGAIYGLLHHNEAVYQDSLTRIVAWVKQYFDQSAEATKAMLDNLQDLQKNSIKMQEANLSATLQLFDTYAEQSRQAAQTPSATQPTSDTPSVTQ